MPKKTDITGQQFGLWAVEGEGSRKNGRLLWTCVCECGVRSDVDGTSLRLGKSRSCGCLTQDPLGATSLIGQRFGRLLVTGYSHTKQDRYWHCQCDCGKSSIAKGGALTGGKSKSCGCLTADALSERATIHGLSRSRTYRCWLGMRTRCYNKSAQGYEHYGGRGIVVCDRWNHSFDNFMADMGEVGPGKTLDRIDVNGDYCPENCRWATTQEQARNTRSNRILTYNGESKCLAAWAEIYKISNRTLLSRLRYGWTLDKALNTPVKTRT